MRIALVGPTYPFRGGIAHYTTMLYQTLGAHGHQVRLYSFARLYPHWLFPGRTDRDPSTQIFQLPCTYTLDTLNPLTWWQTAWQIAEFQPEILILQWWVTILAPMWNVLSRIIRPRGSQILYICHNVLPHERQFWDRWLTATTLATADRLIVGSFAEQARLRRLLPAQPCAIVPHPIHELFTSTPFPRALARQRLRLDANQMVIVFFGFIRAYKGVNFLLEALPEVITRLPSLHLLLVGEFWEDRVPYQHYLQEHRLQEHVTIVDRYVGNEEVPLYFSAADVAVLPFIHTTQSGVVQLAFGCGVPVITTAVGGLPDVVQEGITGLLVPPADAHAIAQAIIRFFEEQLGPTMRANIVHHRLQFSWERLVSVITQGDREE